MSHNPIQVPLMAPSLCSALKHVLRSGTSSCIRRPGRPNVLKEDEHTPIKDARVPDLVYTGIIPEAWLTEEMLVVSAKSR